MNINRIDSSAVVTLLERSVCPYNLGSILYSVIVMLASTMWTDPTVVESPHRQLSNRYFVVHFEFLSKP